jgi:hypothetical protein
LVAAVIIVGVLACVVWSRLLSVATSVWVALYLCMVWLLSVVLVWSRLLSVVVSWCGGAY